MTRGDEARTHRGRTLEPFLKRLRAGDAVAVEDAWDELIHQGDVFAYSPASVSALVEGLGQRTGAESHLLYLLAAMCVGRPEPFAAEVRASARPAVDFFRRLLQDADAEVRAGAISVLTATQAAGEGDVPPFAELAMHDPDRRVRAEATLALGVVGAAPAELSSLLDADEPIVRCAAAFALARQNRVDPAVQDVLVDAITDWEVAAFAADDARARPPWDKLYRDPADTVTELGLPVAERSVTLLLARLPALDAHPALDATTVLLSLLFDGSRVRDDRAYAVLRDLADHGRAWAQAVNLWGPLRDHGLPTTREELRAWLEERGR